MALGDNTKCGSKTRYLIFKTLSGFGYDIYVGDQRIIHQVHVPAIVGKLSFQTELQASKAAALVVSKIERGDFPPAVSLKELDSLGLLPDPSNR